MDFNVTYKEGEFIALLKQKSLQAFNSLYDKYAPALYTVVLQIIRDEEIANNVIQKVFLDIMYKIDSYDPDKERFFIWMFKIARNAAIDVTKSKNNQQTLKQQPTTEKLPHGVANLEMDNYGLKKVIMKLNEEQKILVDLCYYRGFTHDEIAKELNIPIENVKSGLRVAVLELRTLLF